MWEGNVTQYQYDDFGRRFKVISPDTGTTTYVYDEAGNVIQKTDAKGTVVNYTYDALNRVTSVQFSDSTQNITYTYDSTQVSNGIGRLTGRTDSSGSYKFWYDAQGNLTKEEKTIGIVPIDYVQFSLNLVQFVCGLDAEGVLPQLDLNHHNGNFRPVCRN